MKLLLKILDIILVILFCVMIFPVFCIFLGIILIESFFMRNINNKFNIKNGRRLLRLVPANLFDIERKGVMWMIHDSDENGYFSHVYTVHYPADKHQRVSLSPTHTIIEIGRVLNGFKKTGFLFLYTFLNGCFFLWNIIKMRAFVRNEISVIRGQDPDHMGLAAVVLSKITAVPCCVSIHADHDKRYSITKGKEVYTLFGSKQITDLLRRFSVSSAAKVMVIRESLIPYARRMGAKAENIRLIPHGIDFKEFENSPDFEFKKNNYGDKKLIVFAGRLYPENYVLDMMYILAKVKKEMPDILLLILGDGPEKESAEAFSKKSNLMDNVQFLGFQSREMVVKFRKIADINLCLMGGFSLIEAAASGKPIVSYDVEWHYELVKNGVTGYLIKEHDIDKAAEAIVAILNNHDLAKRIGENARILAIERHAIKKTSQIKRNCYDELINARFSH